MEQENVQGKGYTLQSHVSLQTTIPHMDLSELFSQACQYRQASHVCVVMASSKLMKLKVLCSCLSMYCLDMYCLDMYCLYMYCLGMLSSAVRLLCG